MERQDLICITSTDRSSVCWRRFRPAVQRLNTLPRDPEAQFLFDNGWNQESGEELQALASRSKQANRRWGIELRINVAVCVFETSYR